MQEENANPERILLLVAVGLLAFVFVWFQWKLLLLAFAGLLLSIVLHAVADWVTRHTRLNPLFAYLATLATLAAVFVLAAWLLIPRVVTQVIQAAAVIPQSLNSARQYLSQSVWGTSLLHLLATAKRGSSADLTLIAKTIMASGVDLLVIVVIGFFGALNPRGYREGLLALVPARRRARTSALLATATSTLRSWVLGQMIPMAVLGCGSLLGLWLLHVPLAFTLALLTGLLIFVPYVGSISSGLLAIVLAFQRGPSTALYVFLLYFFFHLLEGYLLTPLVQKQAVRLPPVLTILAQFFLWSFAGVLGVAVAAPLAAVGLALLKTVYLSPGPEQSPVSSPDRHKEGPERHSEGPDRHSGATGPDLKASTTNAR